MSDQHSSSAKPIFRKSIATVSLSGTLPEKLEAAAAVGFDGVEIFENDLLTYDGSPADIRRIAEGLGLEITIFQPFRDFEAMPDNIRARNLDRAERKFDIMQALGTDLVLVCSNVQPSSINDDAKAAAEVHTSAAAFVCHRVDRTRAAERNVGPRAPRRRYVHHGTLSPTLRPDIGQSTRSATDRGDRTPRAVGAVLGTGVGGGDDEAVDVVAHGHSFHRVSTAADRNGQSSDGMRRSLACDGKSS